MKNIILILGFIISIPVFSQTFDVQNYEINLLVPNSYYKTFEANTLIDIKFLEDNTSEIDLMLLRLTVDSVFVGTEQQSFMYNDTTVHVQLTNSYQTNDLLQIRVYYHGYGHTDSDGWGGIIASDGYFFNLGVSMSADPHNYGRVWYPCVDNFTDKATYTFNITCQDSRTAICGGTLQSETDNSDGTKTFSWLLDKETPTYLTSIAIGNYEVYRDTFDAILGEIPVAIYARSTEIANVPASFIHLEDIFNIYENRFGAYRWSRVGFVGVPFNSGAMEHAENIAYPNSSINGNLNYETLFAHELAHSWFGNLTTCSTAGDMWINEGWASYCEAIFTEDLYGIEEFKTYNRTRHKDNLQYLHFNEGAYWPLYDIPTDLTYSSHVYKKGADVAHSLRGHLGDEVFFDVMTNFLADHQYQSVNSYEFRDYLTTNTAYNLDGFFDSWVFDGGWLQFAVDSFEVTPNAGQFEVEVFMRQKLKGRTSFGLNNRIPIQFLSADFNRIDTMITISGEVSSQTFTIPFQPYSVLCDMEEQVSDATTDQYSIIKNIEDINYSSAFFKTSISQVTDSVLFRVEHNWVAPDGFLESVNGLDVHPERYWKIDGIFNDNLLANGQFYYSRSTAARLDKDFITTHVDSLVVLYRAYSGDDWQIIPHTRSGSTYAGYLVIDQIQRGEYAFGLWDHHVGLKDKPIKETGFNIFPNPTKNYLHFTIKNEQLLHSNIQIFDQKGSLVKFQDIQNRTFQINIEDLDKGIYYVRIGKENQNFIVE